MRVSGLGGARILVSWASTKCYTVSATSPCLFFFFLQLHEKSPMPCDIGLCVIRKCIRCHIGQFPIFKGWVGCIFQTPALKPKPSIDRLVWGCVEIICPSGFELSCSFFTSTLIAYVQVKTTVGVLGSHLFQKGKDRMQARIRDD